MYPYSVVTYVSLLYIKIHLLPRSRVIFNLRGYIGLLTFKKKTPCSHTSQISDAFPWDFNIMNIMADVTLTGEGSKVI